MSRILLQALPNTSIHVAEFEGQFGLTTDLRSKVDKGLLLTTPPMRLTETMPFVGRQPHLKYQKLMQHWDKWHERGGFIQG